MAATHSKANNTTSTVNTGRTANKVQKAKKTITKKTTDKVQKAKKTITKKTTDEVQKAKKTITKKTTDEVQQARKTITKTTTNKVQKARKTITKTTTNKVQKARKTITKTTNKVQKAKKTITKKTTERKAGGKTPFSPVDLEKLFPPWGSEDALNQTANKEATDITQAVYYDINAHCNLERLAKEKASGSEETFSNMLVFAGGFVEREIGYYMSHVKSLKAEHGEFQPVTPNSRFFEFVTGLGWKMFAICSHSEAFRCSIKRASDRTWGFLLQKIQENFVSIELFAHSRALKWRDILYAHKDYPIPGLPDMKSDIKTYMRWKVDHPHHTVITLDGKLKEPIYNGKLQKHINESIYDPKKWGGNEQDPTLRHTPNGSPTKVGSACCICGSTVSCDCRLPTSAGELVELREYPDTGTGVRALSRFKHGETLDIFMGELLPSPVEDVYPLDQDDDKTGPNKRTLCTICPHEFGNWTRYISHSCQPSTQFKTRTVGNRVICTVDVIRDILPFEEITVNYGFNYWGNKDFDCLCGHCDGSGP